MWRAALLPDPWSVASAAMSTPYNPQAIEARWQQYWLDHGTYEVDNDDPRPPYYVLSM